MFSVICTMLLVNAVFLKKSKTAIVELDLPVYFCIEVD
jgi:hypothetical protein